MDKQKARKIKLLKKLKKATRLFHEGFKELADKDNMPEVDASWIIQKLNQYSKKIQ
jgi:hypothetical protein